MAEIFQSLLLTLADTCKEYSQQPLNGLDACGGMIALGDVAAQY